MKKILASIIAIATLSSLSALGTCATVLDDNTETIYVSDAPMGEDTTLGEEKEITLNTGEIVTLPSWTYLIQDLDGNSYAYEIPSLNEDNYYTFEYILIDSNRRIPGFPVFDIDKNYIGCIETVSSNYLSTNYTLPNNQTITLKPAVDNENANLTLHILYDADDNYDGYEVITMLYSYNRKQGDCYILPNGEELEISTNEIGIKYNADGDYVGYNLYSVSEPCDDDNTDNTIGDSIPITEFTVGESTYPRGDINLDGKVNTLDLLMLKKYLLGLMEW